MTTACQCLIAWFVLGAIAAAIFWAAAVLAKRDDQAHGRE